MDTFCCSIVPPYILEHIAEGQHSEASRLAKQTLSAAAHLHQCRVDLHERRHGDARHFTQPLTQNIVPGYVLEDISKAEGTDEATEKHIAQTIISSQQVSQQRLGDSSAAAVTTTDTQLKINRSVFDMAGLFEKQGDVDVSDKFLPGKPVRSEGQAAVADKAVNQVYDHTKEVLEFLHSVFKYNSVDGQNLPIVSSVHSLSVMLNASWVGVDTKAVPPKKYNQMLYGDGLPGVMEDFTDCVDVIGHEMMVSRIRDLD
jgi:Zn-dependent metalloprotease